MAAVVHMRIVPRVSITMRMRSMRAVVRASSMSIRLMAPMMLVVLLLIRLDFVFHQCVRLDSKNAICEALTAGSRRNAPCRQ